MASLADLARKGAVRSLLALAREDGPVTASQFANASGLFHESAKRLREELEGAGLIEVRVLRRQGNVEVMEIHLTPLGREVARHLRLAEDVLQRPRAPKR